MSTKQISMHQRPCHNCSANERVETNGGCLCVYGMRARPKIVASGTPRIQLWRMMAHVLRCQSQHV